MKFQIEASLKRALEKGIQFLHSRQLPSGEFRTMKWQTSKVDDASYVRSVFITSIVLHSLRHVEKFVQIGKISQQAIEFLLGEMEYEGLWRFHGKKSYIHFDIDTTCCVLATLKEWGIKLDYDTIASGLLRYRNAEGVFNTWILDVDPPFEKKDNNVDWVVNANALFFYSLLNQSLPEVERYLIGVVETETFKQRSPYYESPLGFIYCFSRAYSDGHSSRLKPAIAKIKNYLLDIKVEDESYGGPLESALASVGLLNSSEGSAQSLQAIEYLLNTQLSNGGWPKGVFFTGGPYMGHHIVFGSEELTTAIALEAISKYREKSEG